MLQDVPTLKYGMHMLKFKRAPPPMPRASGAGLLAYKWTKYRDARVFNITFVYVVPYSGKFSYGANFVYFVCVFCI